MTMKVALRSNNSWVSGSNDEYGATKAVSGAGKSMKVGVHLDVALRQLASQARIATSPESNPCRA